jgi:cell division septation protein DedD/nucleoid DNA-binding protein
MKVDVLADLKSLLYHNDEVQLPNLGVISTRQNDFYIDRGKGEIYPSAKQVHSFDRIINTNNHALVNLIAHKYGMSYDEAHQVIQQFIDEYSTELKNQGLSIPNVGDLKMDENGRVAFTPNPSSNYAIENYGLPVLKNVHPVHFEKTKKEEVKTVAEVSTIKVQVPSKTYTELFVENRLLQMMVIMVLLLITSIPLTTRYIKNSSNRAGMNIATPDADNDKENTNTYDNNLSDNEGYKITPSKQKAKETTSVTTPVVETPITKAPVVKAPNKVEAKKETPKPTPKPPKEEKPVNVESHLIVLGAFGSKENAEKLQLNIYSKGYKNASVTKLPNGFYRVGIILDCKESEIDTRLNKIKKDYKSAYWKR